MKNLKTFFAIIPLLFLFVSTGRGQIYFNDFGTTAITTKPFTGAPGTFDANLNTSSWTTSAAAFGGLAGNGGAPSQSLSLNNSSGTPTFTLTFNVNAGYQLSVTSFNFWRVRSNSGATNWSMTINGTAVGSGTIPTSGALLGVTSVSSPISGLTGPITIVYTMSGASGTGTARLDDFTLNGSVTPTVVPGASTISAGIGSEPATLSSLINAEGDAVLNFDFTILDDGSTPATDIVATQISQIVINQGAGNDIGTWTDAIAGALLTDGTNTQTTNVTINPTNITFSSIPNALGNLGYIADNASKTYTLKIWLKTTLGGTLPLDIDGKNFVFGVDNTSFTFNGGSSTLASSQSVNSGGTNNAVTVAATKLKFVQEPTNTNINATMIPVVTIEATDVNNNRDIDKTGSVGLVSTGTMTGPVTAALASGFGTFSNIVHTAIGTGLSLTASLSGITDAVSTTFNISVVAPGLLLFEDNFNYTGLLTANGYTALSGTGTNDLTPDGTTGLSYTNYGSTGIGNAILVNNNGQDVSKTFAQQNSPTTVYASFLVNISDAKTNGDYVFAFAPSSGATNYRGRFFIKASTNAGFVKFGISNNGTANYGTTDFALNTTHLVVVKYQFISGSSATSTVYVNPDLVNEPGLNEVSFTDNVGGNAPADLTSFAIRQGSATTAPTFVMDGIRIATNWGALLGNPTFSSADNIGAGNYHNVTVSSNTLSLAGNVNINGDLTMTSGTLSIGANTLTLNGTVTSTAGTITGGTTSNLIIGGTGALGTLNFTGGSEILNNLTINRLTLGTANIGSNLNVQGTLDLSNGNIVIGSNTLTLGTSVSSRGTLTGGSNTSYIVGNFERWFDAATVTDVVFPVGTTLAKYRPATISYTAAPTTGGKLKVYASNDGTSNNTNYPKDGGVDFDTYSEGLWSFTPTTLDGGTYNISFVANGIGGVALTSNLRVMKRTDNLAPWAFVGSNVTGSGGNSSPLVGRNGLTGFSEFGIGGRSADGNTLNGANPVTLATLNSSIIGRGVKLNWTTAEELNNSGFEIERAVVSSEKLEYRKIAFMNGKGTVNTPTNYSYEDKNLNTGKYKYRLKQIDFNGNFEYFNLNGEIEIGVPKKFDLSQNYPNPFNPTTKINFDLPRDSKVELRIYDMLGREVTTLVNEVRTAGYYTVEFNASSFASGTYFYRLNTGDFSMVKKMLIIK